MYPPGPKRRALTVPYHDVFISYKREDAERANAVRERLERAGFTVYWDQKAQCGGEWVEELDREVASARCVVVLWSVRAVSSPWVRHEATVAVHRGVYAPARIDMVSVPEPYKRLNAADLSDWDGSPGHGGFQALVHRVAALAPRGGRLTRVRAALRPYRDRIVAAAFAVTALGILVWQTGQSLNQVEAIGSVASRQAGTAAKLNAFQRETARSARDQARVLTSLTTGVSALDSTLALQLQQTRLLLSTTDSVDRRLAAQERRVQPLVRAGAQLDPQYQRFRAYFNYWQLILTEELDPEAGFAVPDIGLTNQRVLRRVPTRFLERLKVAADTILQMVRRAERGANGGATLAGLVQHARDVDDSAFGARLFSTQDEGFVATYFRPTSVTDGYAKALATLDDLLGLYASIEPLEDGTCFSFANVGGVRYNQFEILSHDLTNLFDLPLRLLEQDVLTSRDLVDVLLLDFPLSGFPADECRLG